MPRFIIKLDTPDGPFYCEWSTASDAPATYLLTREELKTYIQEEYGRQGSLDFEERMSLVERQGHSIQRDGVSVESLVAHNRAGPDEECLSIEEIIELYK